MKEEIKIERARKLIKAIPIIRKALNDYLDDLLLGASFYLSKKRVKRNDR